MVFHNAKRQWHSWSLTKHKTRRWRDLNNKVTLKAWEHLHSHTQFSLPSFLISYSQSADVLVRKEGKTSQKQHLLPTLWKKMGFIRHSFCRREILELRNCHWTPGSFDRVVPPSLAPGMCHRPSLGSCYRSAAHKGDREGLSSHHLLIALTDQHFSEFWGTGGLKHFSLITHPLLLFWP